MEDVLRVELGKNDGFDSGVVENVKNILENTDIVPVARQDTEYVAVISFGSVCIFRVNIGQKSQLIKGSMLRQIDGGSLKIGFVDLYDDDIVQSIRTLIREHWMRVWKESGAECAVVFSPQEVRDL